jgi:hypothetical protein
VNGGHAEHSVWALEIIENVVVKPDVATSMKSGVAGDCNIGTENGKGIRAEIGELVYGDKDTQPATSSNLPNKSNKNALVPGIFLIIPSTTSLSWLLY